MMRARSLPVCLCVSLMLGWFSIAVGQEVRFRLADDDPNENSEVTRSPAFSPDGTILAVGYGRFIGLLQDSRPGQAILWDTKTGVRKRTITAKIDGVCAVAFSPDGKTLAIAEYPGLVRIWDMARDRERLVIQVHSIINAIALSPDGHQIAAGIWPGTTTEKVAMPDAAVMIWDPSSGQLLRSLKGNGETVRAVGFSPDGKTLASGGDDGQLKHWNLSDGLSQASMLSRPTMYKWPTKKPFETPFEIESLAFSPDGRTLAVAAGIISVPGKPQGISQVVLWSLNEKRKSAVFSDHPGSVTQVVFSIDGKLLATACRDGKIRLWDCGSHREVGAIEGGSPIAFSPDGRKIAWNDGKKSMVLGDLAGLLQP